MQRHEWKFTYPADVLVKACDEKIAFHNERLSVWQTQLEKTEEELKQRGITIDRSAVASSLSKTGRAPMVMIDVELQRDLSECVAKEQHHKGMISQYDAWKQVLNSQGAATFSLHHDDWLFFFGK